MGGRLGTVLRWPAIWGRGEGDVRQRLWVLSTVPGSRRHSMDIAHLHFSWGPVPCVVGRRESSLTAICHVAHGS